MASVFWKELTAEDLRAKAAADAIVILPIASIEQHGPHLPVGVDSILCEGVCKAAAELVRDVETVVAPTIWCGMAEHHMAFGGTFTFDIPTYYATLLMVVKSIQRGGFKRLLIINGHGGNISAMASFVPDLTRETGLTINAATYFEVAREAMLPFLEDQIGVMHACEAETSMMMVLAPETVKHDRLPDAIGMSGTDPKDPMRPLRTRYRSFKDMTASGVRGDARKATAEKGEKLLFASARAVADIICNKDAWR
jgi:creatinine amidohydrolase